MKLNKELIMQPKTVVYAKNKNEIKLLCEWADSEGLVYKDGDKYIDYFNRHNIHEIYYGFEGGFHVGGDGYDHCVKSGFTILSFDDVVIESDLLVADFSNAKVGDRVKCLLYGDGVIIAVTIETDPFVTSNLIKVEFKEDGHEEYYGISGLVAGYGYCNTLFYYFEGQFPTIEACKRPLPKIEVDEKVLVIMDDEEVKLGWKRSHFSKFTNNTLYIYGGGRTSWSDSVCSLGVKYWKLASDESINSGNLDEIDEN